MKKIILIFIIFVSCSEFQYQNLCDPKSDQFTKGLILLKILGESRYKCNSFDIDISSSVFEITPNLGVLSESGSSLSVGSSQIFVIRLFKAPTANVTIQIVSSQPSLATLSTNSLTFPQETWSSPLSFTATGINDSIINGDRNFNLKLKIATTDEEFHDLSFDIPMVLKDNERRLFLSTSPYRGGEFGGIGGADLICNSDIKCPAGSSCKAMILGPTRIASATANLGDGQVDWVLHPFAHYYSPSPANTLITTTNQTSLLQIPFASVIDAVGIGGWLGSSSGYVLGGNTCFNWTENTAITTGFMFRTQYTDNTLFGGNFSCSNQVNLICVEF